jgi:isoleucyl-tRNA synthetase
MSKKLKNYPDPMDVVSKYGADCVRLFLVNSPVVRGENLRFREEGVREILTNVILKWINSLNFYLGQVELYDFEAAKEGASGNKFVYRHDAPKSTNVMDRWILARCQTLIQHVDQEMSGEWRLGGVVRDCALTVSVPAVHGHSAAARPHRRPDQLVHSLQPDAAEGCEWYRGHRGGAQHVVRDAHDAVLDHGECGF